MAMSEHFSVTLFVFAWSTPSPGTGGWDLPTPNRKIMIREESQRKFRDNRLLPEGEMDSGQGKTLDVHHIQLWS